MKTKLRLYVWHNVLTDYSSGVMFAYAASADDARRQIVASAGKIVESDLGGEPSVYDKPVGFAVWGGS